MSIRRATAADLPRLLAWAEAFANYHPLVREHGRDPAAIAHSLGKMIDSEDAVILMHDHGAIGGVIAPLWINPAVRIATELFWWAERDGRPLMRAFEAWAVEREADLVQMIAILGVDQDVTALYDRAGYMPAELNFVKPATGAG